MYVVVRWNNKKTYRYVLLMENHWDKVKCRSTSKRIKTLGIYEDLVKEDPEAIEKLRRRYAAETRDKRKSLNDEALRLLRARERTVPPTQADTGKSSLLNYSCFILKVLWRKLGLDYLFGRIASRAEAGFDVEKTLLLMIAERLANNFPETSPWDLPIRWIGSCTSGVEPHHQRRCLEMLDENSGEISKWLVKKLVDSGLVDDSLLYHHVLELSPPGDEFRNSCPGQQCQGTCPGGFCGVSRLSALRSDKAADSPRRDALDYSMHIIVGRNGTPLFHTLSRNREGVVEALSNLGGLTGPERTVAVVDSDRLSLDNAFDLVRKGGGFLTPQSLRELDRDLLDEACAKEGWIPRDRDLFLTKDMGMAVETASGPVECRLSLTLAARSMMRDHVRIMRAWKDADSVVRLGSRALVRGDRWRRYVSAADGSMDKARLKDDLRLVGMRGFLWHAPAAPGGRPAAPGEIVEKCLDTELTTKWFKGLLPTLTQRLVFMKSESEIRGSGFLCYLALLFTKMLEAKLREAGTPLSCVEISQALAEAVVVPSPCLEERVIFRPIEAPLQGSRSAHLRFKGEETADKVDLIMRCVGLTPIRGNQDRNGLARCLRTKFKTDGDICARLQSGF